MLLWKEFTQSYKELCIYSSKTSSCLWASIVWSQCRQNVTQDVIRSPFVPNRTFKQQVFLILKSIH